jgi:hypothetical protein
MSEVMDEEIKRWTARRKSALVLEMTQGNTTVAAANRQFGFSALAVDKRAESEGIRERSEAFARLSGSRQFSDSDNTQTAILTRAPHATARAWARDSGWHPEETDGGQTWAWSSDRPTIALSPSPACALVS